MTVDAKARRIYLPTADYEAAPAAEGGKKPRRPKMKPGTFKILVVGS
jgi:hypothetical protein